MDLYDFAAAVFIGNVLTAWFLWGLWQFHKHDYRAAWPAYGAVLFPLGIAVISMVLTGQSTPQFDALALR